MGSVFYSSQDSSQLAILYGMLTDMNYIAILENYLMSLAYIYKVSSENDCIFIQDGSQAHTENIKKQLIPENGIQFMN